MSYQLIILTSNESLTWAYPFTGGIVVADINNVTANANDYILTLPPANLVPTGQSIIFNNVSVKSFKIAEFGSLDEVAVIGSGKSVQIYLTDSSDAAGHWGVINFGGASLAITAFTAESSDGSVIIDNGKITSPGGTIDFTISQSLTNLNDLTGIAIPGFPIITDNLPLQWTTRSLVAGVNMDIANPDGVADNPIINLQSSLTGLTGVAVSDVSGNSSVVTSAGIVITDNSGNVCTVSSTGIATSSSTNNPEPFNAAAWCCFTDTGSGCASAIVIQSSYNILSVTGASGVYTITFTTALTSNNYAVLTSLQRQGSNLNPFQTFVQSKQDSSLVVVCTDTQGNLVAPYNGMSLVVFSN